MELSHTAIQHWVCSLQPPTHVTLATLSLEAAPELVGVMECGVGQLQCVSSVSLWNGFLLNALVSIYLD